jgi:hypothetical protein
VRAPPAEGPVQGVWRQYVLRPRPPEEDVQGVRRHGAAIGASGCEYSCHWRRIQYCVSSVQCGGRGGDAAERSLRDAAARQTSVPRGSSHIRPISPATGSRGGPTSVGRLTCVDRFLAPLHYHRIERASTTSFFDRHRALLAVGVSPRTSKSACQSTGCALWAQSDLMKYAGHF